MEVYVFGDEFDSRLRFNHGGIVAMANESLPNTNGSQFFFTLDKCDWLDNKHTIFGKVTGDSIYNLLRLGEVDTSKDDCPAPKILSVEVLWNPFEDIVPRVLALQPVAQVKEPVKKPILVSVSVGEEADEEEEEKELAAVKQMMMSFFSSGEEAEEEDEVLRNPLEDILPRMLALQPVAEEEEKELAAVKQKIMSLSGEEAGGTKPGLLFPV